MSKLLCVITGPTACGKTDVAIQLAQYFNTHILSADSRQFYRELKIGAATPTAHQLEIAPHHFIGHLSVKESYNVFKYEQDALALSENLFKNKDLLILTGGSGLYIDAVCNGIDLLPDPDPELRQSLQLLFDSEGIVPLQSKLMQLDPVYFDLVDKANPVRLIRAIEVCLMTGKPYSSQRNQLQARRPFRILKIALNRPKEELHERIALRTEQMIEDGLVDEVDALREYRAFNALNTVGYKEVFQYLDGDISLVQAIENIKTNTRRYAKRQLTWFRRDPNYVWFDASESEKIAELIRSAIK